MGAVLRIACCVSAVLQPSIDRHQVWSFVHRLCSSPCARWPARTSTAGQSSCRHAAQSTCYEASILIPPLLLYLLGPSELRLGLLRGVGWFVWPVLAYVAIYPVQQVEQFVRGHFGGAGLLVLKPIGCVVVAVAFVGAAAALHRLVSRMRQEQEAKPADATVLSAA